MFSLAFVRERWRELAFGFTMCLCSSFGQTFFISLFSGQIRAEFGITDGEFGSIYSAGTLASAAVLIWAGRLVDRFRLAAMGTGVLAALAMTCVLMSAVWTPLMLVLAIFGLRQFGQGLASHTGITAMARRFSAERGRAVAIAALGHSAGDAALPSIVVAALIFMDWRNVWVAAAVVLVLAIPLTRWLVSERYESERLRKQPDAPDLGDQTGHTVAAMLREASFWFCIPALLTPSFVYTGLIFHQVTMAQSKGWPLTVLAGSYVAFATAALCAVIFTGPLVDKTGARRLVPFFLTPLALSCLVIWGFEGLWAAPLFMVFLGINGGMTQVLLGAVWAELYGVKHLGAIRALGQALMVFSTGLAPAAFGLLIDAGTSIGTIALAAAGYCVLASGLGALAPEPNPTPQHQRNTKA